MVLELMSRSHEDDHHGAGQVWTASIGLRAVPVQYGLDGPVLRARTRAVKHLVNQLDGRQTGRNHPSNTV